MKLVETDTALANDDVAEVSRKPRPEHRKTYVSLLVTGAVLVGTVAAVYLLFPKRDHEVIGAVIEHHRAPGALDLERPSLPEVTAWTIGVLARPVPWPSGDGLTIEGVRHLVILKKDAAMVRYQVDGVPVTLVAMVPWDAPPRVIKLDDGTERAVWWRKGAWTMIAVGPLAGENAWRKRIGAP
jgi:hypothetical protein